MRNLADKEAARTASTVPISRPTNALAPVFSAAVATRPKLVANAAKMSDGAGNTNVAIWNALTSPCQHSRAKSPKMTAGQAEASTEPLRRSIDAPVATESTDATPEI